MKVTLIKACDKLPAKKMGDSFDIEPGEFETMYNNGLIVTASEYESSQSIIKARDAAVDVAIEDAVNREAILPKDDKQKGEVRANAIAMESVKPGLGISYIHGMKGKEQIDLTRRFTPVTKDGDAPLVAVTKGDIKASGSRYVELQDQQNTIIRAGASKEVLKAAGRLSLEAGSLLRRDIYSILARGDNLSISDCIKAADDVDPAIGTLNTGIVLMRNLGFLKNMLPWLNKLSTDLRNEPIMFGQNALTRYITPPNVLTYVPNIGMTSDVNTINAWKNTITAANPAGTNVFGTGATVANVGTTLQTSNGQGAQYSGTQFLVTGGVATKTLSTPSATDVSVVLNNYQSVALTFNNLTLSSTLRNPFAEQSGASMYSLAEAINLQLLATLYQAKWNPKTGVPGVSIANGQDPVTVNGVGPMGLANVIKIKNAFSLNKMPDVARFALLQSVYHDAILTDSNLLNAKAILALITKDESAFKSGSLPPLFGVDILESQLASGSLTVAAGSVATGTFTDTPLTGNTGIVAQLGGVAANACIGFAGNSASALFVARTPIDYTKVFDDIPATAALQIVTEPDSGLSLLIKKWIDHGLEQVYVQSGLMYNFAQGDPRQGFILIP